MTAEARTESGVSPVKGVVPVTCSKRTTPRDQMSVRASTDLGRRACSGDMYAGEPRSISARVSVGAAPSDDASAASAFEIPKSRTLTSGDPSARSVRKRFAGFRSR